MKTVTTGAECPEGYGAVKLVDVMQSESVQCPECGAEHEVVEISPCVGAQKIGIGGRMGRRMLRWGE